MENRLRVLDVARAVVDEVNQILDGARRPLLYNDQLRESAQSIAANIREAYGRRKGPERNQFFRYAIGSAEETEEHLRANHQSGRIPSKRFWCLRDRIIVTRKMLNRIVDNS